MNIADYERYILSAELIDRNAARLVAAELTESSFMYGPGDTYSDAHTSIQRAIVATILDGTAPDVATVAAKLGPNLPKVGGMAYLTKLAQSLSDAGITSTAGLPNWADVVDKSARLHQMFSVLTNRVDQLSNISRAMEKIENVDEFLADTLSELGAANAVKLEYHPISEAVVKAKGVLESEADGKAISWLPIGWPSLNQFKLLPYRSLFVILGISSMGKSQLLAQLLLGSAVQIKRQNLTGAVVFNTYEMSGIRYVLRMAACLAGVNLLSADALNKNSVGYRKLHDALDFVHSLPIYYSDADMGSAQIFNQCALLGSQHGGIRVIGIDYSELVPDRNSNSEEQRVSSIFRNAQKLSRSTESCTIMLSQFPQAVLNNDDTKLGGAWQTRYSGSGHHAAEVSGIIYNPPQMRQAGISFSLPKFLPDADNAYLVIGKNKDGKTGWVKLNWTPGFTRFSDPALLGFGMNVLYEGIQEVQQDMRVETDGDF